MTPEAQRIAIAEAIGWTDIRQGTSCLIGTAPDGRINWAVPDYPADLNAMAQARRCLTPEQLMEYGMHLGVILVDKMRSGKPAMAQADYEANPRWLWDASADEHAEAFLRTLGKWTGE